MIVSFVELDNIMCPPSMNYSGKYYVCERNIIMIATHSR